MSARQPLLRVLFAALLFAAVPAPAEDDVPVICGTCGWEILPGNRFCGNCGAAADGTAAAPSAPSDAPAEPSAADAAAQDAPSGALVPAAASVPKLVDAEGRRFAALAGNPAAQLAAVRNALAVAALAPDAVPADRRADLLRRETDLLAAISRADAPCPVCRGVGTVKEAPAPKAGASAGSIEASSVSSTSRPTVRTCPFCGGRGAAPRVRDRKELAGLLGLGRRDHARAAQADGLADFHGILVPRDLNDALTLPDRIALLRAAAFAHACASCAGTGTVPCRDCGGFGRISCDNDGFHRAQPAVRAATAPSARGGSVRRIESQVLDSPASSREACPVCGGRREAPGAVACRRCGGRGLAVCTACNGTGLTPECRRCRGEGAVPCRRCNGTGRDARTGEACAACAGEGRILCDTCGGSGHGR